MHFHYFVLSGPRVDNAALKKILITRGSRVASGSQWHCLCCGYHFYFLFIVIIFLQFSHCWSEPVVPKLLGCDISSMQLLLDPGKRYQKIILKNICAHITILVKYTFYHQLWYFTTFFKGIELI